MKKRTVTPTTTDLRNTARTAEPRNVVRPDAIARRAYELFEARGRTHGGHDQDWLRAERELAEGLDGAPAGRK